MKRVILVDDEQNVLNALRRELQDEYEMDACISPAEAIRHARETEYDVVIADYLMPEMNGVQFLQAFRALQPDVPRLILSAHTDIQGLLNAINETHIFRFIAKPWDRSELLFVLGQAVKYGHLLKDNRRLAERVRNSSSAPEAEATGVRRIFQVALVNGDTALSRFVQDRLESEGAQDTGNDGLWHEIAGNTSRTLPHIGFRVQAFATGKEALEQAPLRNYDLVIAAQTLSDMGGIALLKDWQLVQPGSARILLGKPSDLGRLSQAVNDAQVYSFLDLGWEKWDMNALDSGWDTWEIKIDPLRQMNWQVNKLRISVMEALAARELALENARLAELARLAAS